jgi:hypothetical protein
MSIVEDMKIPTEAGIERRHNELWADAINEYGSAASVPFEVAQEIGEEVRALYGLAIAWDGTSSMRSVLAYYGVTPSVVEKLTDGIEGPLNTERRKDKYAKLITHSKENIYAEFSIKELSDMSGLSGGTIIEWAKTTGFYQSREHDKWEARNPDDDRRAEG